LRVFPYYRETDSICRALLQIVDGDKLIAPIC
jgi:hypothetical protein